MSCEYCGLNDSECGVCRDWDRRRNYSRTVSAVMFGVLVVVFTVATVCGLVNVLGGKH